MMRLTDCAALMVCSVEKTTWPVSAAVSAISIVSRSRISPTRITFGACRSAARRPTVKSEKSLPSSRWLKVALRCGCRNSIGSSSVTMWISEFWLISLSIAASVVVLPLPVAPVTKMMPVFSLMISLKIGWQFQPFARRDLRAELAHDDGVVAILPEDIHAEAGEFRHGVAGIAGAGFLQVAGQPLVAADDLEGDRLDMRAG